MNIPGRRPVVNIPGRHAGTTKQGRQSQYNVGLAKAYSPEEHTDRHSCLGVAVERCLSVSGDDSLVIHLPQGLQFFYFIETSAKGRYLQRAWLPATNLGCVKKYREGGACMM